MTPPRQAPTGDEMTLIERIIRLEALVEGYPHMFEKMFERLDMITEQLAFLTASVKHPDPTHCTKAPIIEEIRADVSKLKMWQSWLIGGGVAIGGVVWLISVLLKYIHKGG